MSELSTTSGAMSFHRRRRKSNGLGKVPSATSPSFHRLTRPRYLQDLQKQVELHQRSSSINTNTETPPFPSAPPPYRSNSYSSPSGSFSSGIKRTSDTAFGVGSTLSSPALTVEAQQSDVSRGPYQQQSQSPLSIWPSAFTIPSKIIKNTRKNRRTWSKYPDPSKISILTG